MAKTGILLRVLSRGMIHKRTWLAEWKSVGSLKDTAIVQARLIMACSRLMERVRMIRFQSYLADGTEIVC